jgi:uncharacterized membrane protein
MKDSQSNLKARMQKISLVTSIVGLGLMAFGLVDVLLRGTSPSIPGMVALSSVMLQAGAQIPLGLAAMSAGIVVLALLPILRVLLAQSQYLHNHQLLNVVVALLVFVELLVSVRTGG